MAIKKTSRGYQVQWYDASGSFRKRTYKGIDKDTAKKIERELLASRDRGEGYIDPRKSPTFAEAATSWQQATQIRRKTSTRLNVSGMLSTHLLPRWGDRRVSTLVEQDALDLQRELQDIRKIGPVWNNCIVTIAKSVLAHCARRRWIAASPFESVDMLRGSVADVDPLSPEEIGIFLEHCPAWWRPWFIVSFFTGARPGELAALTWEDVSESTGTFRIRQALRQGVLSSPKTPSSVRDVDMLPPVQQALRQQRAQIAALRLKGGNLPERDHVFLTARGVPVDSTELGRAVWKPVLRKARLRFRRLYQTRHSFASNALAAGEDPLWVSRTMGHSNSRMLFSTYARWLPKATRRDGSALASTLAGLQP